MFKDAKRQKIVNSTIIATEVCCFKEVKQLLVGGITNNFQGCFDNLLPVGGKGVPPFFSCVRLFQEFSSGDAAKVGNFIRTVEALSCAFLMIFFSSKRGRIVGADIELFG